MESASTSKSSELKTRTTCNGSWVYVTHSTLRHTTAPASQPVIETPPDNKIHILQILFVGELAYISLIALIKVSILRLYHHVFPTPYMKKGVTAVYILLALWTVACMILTIFQCTPINAAWDKALVRTGGGHCVDQGAYFIGVAGKFFPSTSQQGSDVLMRCRCQQYRM